MALEDVIARLSNRSNQCEKPVVTAEAAKTLAVTAVTTVTAVSEDTEAKTETPGSLRWLWELGCTDAGPEEVQHLMRYLPREPAERKRVLVAYVAEWLAVAETTPLPHQKQGAGRKAANIALREGTL